VVPTDTVYGLAATVYRPEAVRRIYAIKRREPERRVPVLIASAVDLELLVKEVPRIAWALIDRFWPGPLTLVLPASQQAPDVITQGRGTVAVRVPAARSLLGVLQILGEPIVGTSANVSGQPPALTASEAVAQLGEGPDLVLQDDDAVRAGVSSTVVDLNGGTPVIHRLGALDEDQIRQAVGGRVVVRSLTDPPPQP
jgi:L-threonylcarbamoyladenylate synthase